MGIKYFEHKIENLIVINKITTIHYFEFANSFKSEPESHDFWEIIYTCKNNVVCHVENNIKTLKQGEMIFIKPNDEHYIKTTNDDTNVFIISFSTHSKAMSAFNDKVIPIKRDLERYIYRIIEESKETFDIPISDPHITKMEFKENAIIGGLQVIKNYLEILLVEIMRFEANKNNTDTVFLIKEKYKNNLSGEIIHYLNNNIYNKVNIDDIEKKLHYNKSYIFKKFKEQTGRTIIEYYTLLKIEESKKLLENTNASIADIADKLSFYSASYFCSKFKEIVKITPLQYRNSKNQN